MNENQMKDAYLKINPSASNFDAFAFGGTTQDMPNQLANLVLNGVKTATSSLHCIYEVEKEPLPTTNNYSIILDSNDNAVCIIKTTKVYTTPFNQVTSNHAFKEGEGNRSLDYWKLVHQEFFENEISTMNLTFTEDMLVVCEEFEVVYPI